jgi:hypothetical protein
MSVSEPTKRGTMKKLLGRLATVLFVFGMLGLANATSYTVYYGDDDGFGVGSTYQINHS